MPERLMYHTGETMGEKASKERRLTTTERQKVLTSPQKIALRIESPHLRRSNGVAVIFIKFLID